MAAIVYYMKRLFWKYNGLLAATLSFILVVGGSLQVLQATLREPSTQACKKGIEASIMMRLSPWFSIHCPKKPRS